MEKTIIDDVQKILNTANVEVVERLMGGMSNYTYVVKADDLLYTYRIPGDYSEYFVDRRIEKANIKLVESLNITNKTIYLNVDDGKKMTTYLPGKPLSTIDSDDYPYQQVVQVLKTIHQSNLKAVNDYDPFGRLSKYEEINHDLGFHHPTEYHNLQLKFFNFRDFLNQTPKVLTHGDSQPSNFVLNENQLFVVDFEFCGNNDPIYDIACFANKKYEDGLKLLDAYFTKPNYEEKLKFHLWRCFQCFQWYNVAIFKEMMGLSKSLHIDFAHVANHYLELIKFLLEKISRL